MAFFLTAMAEIAYFNLYKPVSIAFLGSGAVVFIALVNETKVY